MEWYGKVVLVLFVLLVIAWLVSDTVKAMLTGTFLVVLCICGLAFFIYWMVKSSKSS